MHALVKMQEYVSCCFAKHPQKLRVVEVMLIKLWVLSDFPEIAAQLLRNTTNFNRIWHRVKVTVMHHCVKVKSIEGQIRQHLSFY